MLKELAHAYLGDYCLGTGRHWCTGKIHRFLIGGTLPGNDDNEVFDCTQVYDRCIECGQIHQQTTFLRCPLPRLEEIFEQWKERHLTRLQFDQAIAAAISHCGGRWEKIA
jgi:hypothetical protein